MEVIALWNGFVNNRTLFNIVTLDNRYLIKKIRQDACGH